MTFHRSLRVRLVSATMLAVALSVALPAVMNAHAVVYPRASFVNGREQYVLRVPNEREVPTVRIEIHFPASVRNPMVAEITGWQIQVLQDSAKKVIGAVWTGSLSPHRYVELPFMATNPRDVDSISWQVTQTYANGETIEWNGAPGSKTPASVTSLAQAPITWMNHHITAWIAGAAFFVALAALALSLRRPPTPVQA